MTKHSLISKPGALKKITAPSNRFLLDNGVECVSTLSCWAALQIPVSTPLVCADTFFRWIGKAANRANKICSLHNLQMKKDKMVVS